MSSILLAYAEMIGTRTGRWAAGPAVALALTGAVALMPAQARADVPVDLELVLAIDASGSVDDSEFRLQLQGIAAAFRDERVVEAIARGFTGQIAVALLVWSDAHLPKDFGTWYVIRTADDAEAFAQLTEYHPRRVRNGATGIGSGIVAAIDMMDLNALTGMRRVVDVSGDGVETPLDTEIGKTGMLIDSARRKATSRGVTVNGLAIRTNVPNLDEWYDNNVRIGPGSFVMVAEGYEDFARAMRAKLLKEIDQSAPVTMLDDEEDDEPSPEPPEG